MSGKNIILSAVLTVMVSFSWWLVHASFTKNQVVASNLPSTPDSFMTQAYYTHFDQEGTIQSKLYSPKIVHYSENDRSLLKNPTLEMHTLDHQTWIITADSGTSLHGAKEILLQEDVKVQRIKVLQNSLSTMTTTALTAYPDRDFAETDQPVTIIQPGSVVKSVGMTANLKTGDINLLSQAQGVFDSTQKVNKGQP